MAVRMRSLAVLSFLCLLVQSTSAETCFGFDGDAYTNNTICPGSNACCGVTATCLPNRLCHNVGDANGTFVRGPCALDPYDPTTCAEICLYDETTGFLPRVTICSDGSYCCDKFPSCCEDGTGVFLNDVGQTVASLLATTSQSSTSTSSSSSISTTSTSTSTSSSISTPSTISQVSTPTANPAGSSASSSASTFASASASSSGLSETSKVGLGVGIPLGILVIAGLTAIIIIQRRKLKKAKEEASYTVQPMPPSMYKYSGPPEAPPGEMAGWMPEEMPGEPQQKYYSRPVAVELPVGR